jgi:hypothetical protein
MALYSLDIVSYSMNLPHVPVYLCFKLTITHPTPICFVEFLSILRLYVFYYFLECVVVY